MGYELHIFRREDWNNSEEESNITLDEWLRYVETDPELKLTNGFQSNLPDTQPVWHDSPGFCLWIAHPESVPAESLWFAFRSGSISTKYPDDYTIRKMIQISSVLYAKVQGDDEEYYDNSYFDNKKAETELTDLTQEKISIKKPWWQFW